MDEPMESSVESTTGQGDVVLSSSTDAHCTTARNPTTPQHTGPGPGTQAQNEPVVSSTSSDSPEHLENRSNESNQQSNFSPLLRPGSMVMMSLTVRDYEGQYWPELKTAIIQLLNMEPGAYIPISYEQMYSCVYKCVCKQFSERLYNDLLSCIAEHLESLNDKIKRNESDAVPFIKTFSFLMHQYLQALQGIVPIFNYLNRFYIVSKLKTDLNEELRKLFRTKVTDMHIHTLLCRLEEVTQVPFAISPPDMASIMKNLFALNEDYSKLNPGLFSRYLPNILPPTDPTLIEQYAQEDRRLQEQIASMQRSCDSSRKRILEDDISVN